MTAHDPDTEELQAAAEERVDEQEERARRLFVRLPDQGARDEIARMFHSLAEYLARRFYGRGEPLDDLIQVASLGLLKAIDRFDLERGVKFSTYATATIVGELKRHFRDKGWALRVPRRMQEAGMKVGRTVTVLEAMETAQAYTTASLDAPADEEWGASADRLGKEEEAYELLEGWTSVAPAIRDLPRRERAILYLRFFRGLTQTQIADELGMSQMHVSRLLSRTLANLREQVAEPGS
jgi:RNA polymerase sigma-B factor